MFSWHLCFLSIFWFPCTYTLSLIDINKKCGSFYTDFKHSQHFHASISNISITNNHCSFCLGDTGIFVFITVQKLQFSYYLRRWFPMIHILWLLWKKWSFQYFCIFCDTANFSRLWWRKTGFLHSFLVSLGQLPCWKKYNFCFQILNENISSTFFLLLCLFASCF